MTILIGIVLGLAGLALVLFGIVTFALFRIGVRGFDRVLGGTVAAQTREQIEAALMKIPNALARRVMLKHVVPTGGTIAVAVVRDALVSRMRMGLVLAATGLLLLVAAFSQSVWLPWIWPRG